MIEIQKQPGKMIRSEFFVRAALALFTLVTILGLLVFAAVYYSSPIVDTIHYRLTLSAEVEGRRVVGSGVVRVDYHYALLGFFNFDQPSNIPPISPRVTGEAIELDFGNRGALFVTLAAARQYKYFDDFLKEGNSSAGRIVPYAWGQPPILDRPDLMRLHKLSPLEDLSFSRLPLLVCFRDVSDFHTIARVDPFDMSSCFGPDVKLVSASIELTHDNVTHGIEAKLPWLSKLVGDDDPIERTRRYFRVEQPAVSGLSWDAFKSGYK